MGVDRNLYLGPNYQDLRESSSSSVSHRHSPAPGRDLVSTGMGEPRTTTPVEEGSRGPIRGPGRLGGGDKTRPEKGRENVPMEFV